MMIEVYKQMLMLSRFDEDVPGGHVGQTGLAIDSLAVLLHDLSSSCYQSCTEGAVTWRQTAVH